MIFILKIVIFFLALIFFAAYLSLFERKVIARIQKRLGPNNCGIFGIFQPIADALKLLFKERSTAMNSRYAVWAAVFMFFISLIQIAFIPLSKNFAFLSSKYSLVWLVFFHYAFVFCAILIGLSSRSKYAVIGGVRAYIQIIGSHVPFLLSIITITFMTQSLNLLEIVEFRMNNLSAILIVPIFLVFFITALMITNRTPFDFPEAESELVAGNYVECGGILFGLIYLSDYLNLIFMSSLISTIFFGGYKVLFWGEYFSLIIKTLVIIFTFVLIRSLLPRYKQEQMLYIGFLILTPILMLILIIFY